MAAEPLPQSELDAIRYRWHYADVAHIQISHSRTPGSTLNAIEHAPADVAALIAEVERQRVERAADDLAMETLRWQRGEAEAALTRVIAVALEWHARDDDPVRSEEILAALHGGRCRCGASVSDRGAKYCGLCFPADEAGGDR